MTPPLAEAPSRDPPQRSWSWPFSRLLLVLALLLLLPLLAFLITSMQEERVRIRERTESAAMNLAQISEVGLERQLADTQQFLATLAGRASVRSMRTNRCDPVFGDFQKSHPDFSALTTTALDGNLVCSSVVDVADRPKLTQSLGAGGAPHFTVGRAQKGFITGRWVVPVSQSVRDDSGATKGNIAAWLDLQRLNLLSESTLSHQPKGTVSTLLDDDGVLLAHSSEAKKWVGVNLSAAPEASAALKLNQGFFELTSQTDGIERLYAVRPVEGTRWLVSVGIPTAAMDAELAQASRHGLALFAGALVFSALLLGLGLRYAVRPIKAGMAVSRAVKAGNLQQRVPLAEMGHIREFISLAGHFNAMMDRLAADRQQLAQSEADFRVLFDEMRSGFAVYDIILDAKGVPVDYRFVSVNRAFEEMTGLRAEALIGKRVLEVMPSTEAIWIERYGQVALTGEPAAFESYSAAFKKTYDVRAFRTRPGQLGVMTLDITARLLAEQALAAERALLRRVIDTIPDLIYYKDAAGHYMGCNKAFEVYAGRDEQALVGKTDFDFFDHKTASFFRDQDRQMLESGESLHNEEWVHYPDGHQVLLSTIKTPFGNTPVQALGVLGISRDVTAQFNAQAALKAHDETYRAMLSTAVDGFWIVDLDGCLLEVNQAYVILSGYTREELIGMHISQLDCSDSPRIVAARIKRIVANGSDMFESTHRRKDGEVWPVEVRINYWPEQSRQFVFIRDITQRKIDETQFREAQAKVHNLAFFDPLTQLPNRRLLLDRLQRAVASSARRRSCGAVLQIDLDHFKLLNETQGHEAGNLLLIDVARRLRTCVRDQDSLAHQGGDDFLVILEDLGADLHDAAKRAEMVAEKILQTLREPYQLGDIGYNTQASVGVAVFHTQEDNAEEVLKRADTAMYKAKTDGRNTVRFFDPAMQAALEHRIKLEHELRQALPGNELRLYYQAQVDAVGRVVSAEALIRWEHPVRGLVSPVQFIPLAEESGLILPIGTWVLETACAQLKEWEKKPSTRDLKLAVNVSARQFRQSDFVAQARAIIEHSGVDPRNLKLEMTESMVIDNVADTIEKMHQLKTLGLTFSMDDFGTGYSSLAYLKRLPLDQLKIDQSFVRDISHDPNDAAIVQTIITMGNTLGMNVIAEGVETQQQLDFLRMHGCDTYQGYLFSRPVPLAEFERLLPVDEPSPGAWSASSSYQYEKVR